MCHMCEREEYLARSASKPFEELPLLKPLTLNQDNYLSQEQSPLFNLPAEIRDRIFSYVLASFENDRSKYEENTFWTRPGYFAPQRSETQLLRTCQQAYLEAWFRPWASAEQTIWLGTSTRAPPSSLSIHQLRNTIASIQSRHGDVVLEHFRVFAQLWALEAADGLQEWLDVPQFFPRQITITIRHTDFWWWEDDNKLYIDAKWTRKNTFPSSLQVLNMDLESLERKKVQVDSIIEQMKQHWYFSRKDGVCLFADDDNNNSGVDQVTRWQGSSTLDVQRWLRDEQPTAPGKLDYYIRTATWRVDPRRSVHTWAKKVPRNAVYDGPQQVITSRIPSLTLAQLRSAGIEDHVPADRATTMFEEWRAARIAEDLAARTRRQPRRSLRRLAGI